MLPPDIDFEPLIVGTSCHSPSPPPLVNPHHHHHFLNTRESSFEHHTKWSLSSFWISWSFLVVNLPPQIEIEPVIVGTSCHSPSPPPLVNLHHHHLLQYSQSRSPSLQPICPSV